MIGTVTDPTHDPAPADPAGDPGLAELIRTALVDADDGTGAYLEVGARLDRVSAVRTAPGAVAWQSLHATWDRPWIIAMGVEPAAVARCAVELADEVGVPEGLTLERRAFALLPHALRPVEHWEWDWWYATDPPAARPGESLVTPVPPDDRRITTLLDEASPDAMARPGDRRILGWWGIETGAIEAPGPATSLEEGPRALVAVAAVTTMRPSIPHISSVATSAAWRGRGLARDLCARITRDQLAAGAPAVTLGMHAGNRAARQVYQGLGYRVGYRWASGRLPQRQPPAHAGE